MNQLKPTYNADTRESKPRLRRASKTSGYTAPSQACEALEVLKLGSHPHAVRKPRQYDVTANQLATARDFSHRVRQDTPKTRQHDLPYVHADSPKSRTVKNFSTKSLRDILVWSHTSSKGAYQDILTRVEKLICRRTDNSPLQGRIRSILVSSR